MEILLTAPPNVVRYAGKYPGEFKGISGIYHDPEGCKLGSGGGTVNVLWQHYLNGEISNSEKLSAPGNRDQKPESFFGWLVREKRIIIHSDGQSRRLPAYSAVGKSFIPFPVFKWGRGQRIDQSLFDIQKPLLERILERAPVGMNTLVASGDALVWMDRMREKIPQADVVCVGIWAQPDVATKHGVFVCPRSNPAILEYMLQKPSLETLQSLTDQFLYLLDAGIWLLSDRAVEFLFKASGWNAGSRDFHGSIPKPYDLYSEFGSLLGNSPVLSDEHNLSVSILPLEQAEFYHFGSNPDLIRSTSLLHNRVMDQREIWHKKIKPNPDIFVQNSRTGISFQERNSSIWIENSDIPGGWKLHDHHIITGVPENKWKIELNAGICLDFIPVGRSKWCIRAYGFNDSFRGNAREILDHRQDKVEEITPVKAGEILTRVHKPGHDLSGETVAVTRARWMNEDMGKWFIERGFTGKEIREVCRGDIYDCKIFPVLGEVEISEGFLEWLTSVNPGGKAKAEDHAKYKKLWLKAERLSAGEVPSKANLKRLSAVRQKRINESLVALAGNHSQSIFYQLDLKQAAAEFRSRKLKLHEDAENGENLMNRIHDLMFRSAFFENMPGSRAQAYSDKAFTLLREGMLANIRSKRLRPVMNVKKDQILWGRSPLRLDLAGGWTDTPPYCILYGGSVVNMAVELNGQPPIQVYIRPTVQYRIVIHSIDLGFSEVIKSYEDIRSINKVGSAFAIPKTALRLAGFDSEYSSGEYKSLEEQLREFGGGLDISVMVAVPKGSGLGTSSILAATILASLSDFCSLGWDKHEVALRTLLLEQILTTGGGWQDQMGGLFEGIKLIESTTGLVQKPLIRWAPDYLFTRPETSSLILLYYTGITRVAKQILTEIVQGMFLNSSSHLDILSEMKHHARDTYETIQNHDWHGLSASIKHSWELNQRLDAMTNPPEISSLIDKIKDLTASCKLLGAGGGGYLMIIAKDLQAANRIRSVLQDSPPNPRARFVDWKLSGCGLEITKS